MRSIAFIALSGLVVACESTFGGAPSSSTTSTTSANVSAVTNEHAIEEITNARCAREFTCDNIGAGRVWHDYETCTRDVRLAMRGMLVGQVCMAGVDAYQLSSCINDIKSVQCSTPQGTVERFGSCSNARLCR